MKQTGSRIALYFVCCHVDGSLVRQHKGTRGALFEVDTNLLQTLNQLALASLSPDRRIAAGLGRQEAYCVDGLLREGTVE
jgi:hypothetical protein